MLSGGVTAQQFAYVANFSSNSVNVYSINGDTGALTLLSAVSATAPIHVTIAPSGKFVYVANYVAAGTISAFSVNPTTGALTPVPGSPFAAGTSPRGIAITPSGRFLYSANYGSSDVSGFTINEATGALTPVPGSPFAVGSIPYTLSVSPSGQFLYIPNCASDNISAFTIVDTTGALNPIPGSPFQDTGISKDPTGTGACPVFVAVSPSGEFAFVANHRSFEIAVYRVNPSTGSLAPIARSPFPSATPRPIQIIFGPAGRTIYVAGHGGPSISRDNGSVSVYSLDTATGALSLVAGSPFFSGAATTSVAIDVSGRFAYTTNAYSGTASGFSISASSGALTPLSESPFTVGSAPYSIAIAGGARCPGGASSSISSIYPNSGGNAGLITVTVAGCGLTAGSTLKLSAAGGDDILSGPVTVLAPDTLISASLDLRGAGPGPRSARIKSLAGESMPLTDGFTVLEGGRAELSVDLLGRGQIRVNRDQTYFLSVNNRGNIDAGSGRIWLSFPQFVEWSSSGKLKMFATGQLDGTTYVGIDVGAIAASGITIIPLQLKTASASRFDLKSWLHQ